MDLQFIASRLSHPDLLKCPLILYLIDAVLYEGIKLSEFQEFQT